MTELAKGRTLEFNLKFNREQILSIVFFLGGLLIIALATWKVSPDEVSSFTQFGKGENLVDLPSRATMWALGAFCLFAAAYQWVRGSEGNELAAGLVGFFAVSALLVWATRGGSLSLFAMLRESIVRATPLILGAMSGLWCEKSGVVNIAIEGMMLSGAFTAVAATSATGSPWVGILAAVLTGGMMAALHAVLSIKYKVDQIISGTMINILAAGATRYLNIRLLTPSGNNAPGTFAVISIPVLADIPIIGPMLFRHQPTVFLMFIMVAVVAVIIAYTPWGLRTRAIGEHPRAADTLGVHVNRMRYINVLIGGMVAGIGGAYFSLGEVGRFEDNMTSGKGFVALAALIFGKWTALGGMAAGLLFGFADALQDKMQILKVGVPSEFLQMTPYVLTVIVLAGVIGRAIPPAADGEPYEKQ
jgi:general nucleoside transport system permease protein